jgi:hypothetical protein
MTNNTKSYRINRFAEVEGNNVSGWAVINMVTGLAQDTVYRTFPDARAAADHLKLHYGAIERGW